eukprot:jgi/Psemu1/311724/fgenesh1_kg.819_\
MMVGWGTRMKSRFRTIRRWKLNRFVGIDAIGTDDIRLLLNRCGETVVDDEYCTTVIL